MSSKESISGEEMSPEELMRRIREQEAERDRLLDCIIAKLDATPGQVPEAVIRTIRKHRDAIVPRLIEVLRRTANDAREGREIAGDVHFFTLFLLAEFRAKEALPAILEVVSLPGRLPFKLFGDAITESLARILAALADDRLDLIEELIGNRQLNEIVRWEGIQTLSLFVRDGRLQRDEAVEILHRHLRHALAEGDEEIAGPLASALCELGPEAAIDDLREVVDQEWARGIIDLEDIEKALAGGEAHIRRCLERCPPTGIDDTVAELKSWGSFQEQSLPQPPRAAPPRPLPARPARTTTLPSQPPKQNVGRNDPCPCGSGKKFKRCCGGRG